VQVHTDRIRIVGDHSGYHGGSAAAYRVILDLASQAGMVVSEQEDYDILVVNGEGTMHHNSKGCRRKMAQIAKALVANKRVFLINTIWQDNPDEYAELLKQCRRVVVREALSQQALARQGVDAEVCIDLSYFDPIDETAHWTDFKGQVVFTDFYAQAFDSFVWLNSKWAQQFQTIDMQRMSWSSLIKSLRTASCLVTGRHHAIYAACRAECPFITLPGNSHKIEGLLAMGNFNEPLVLTPSCLRRAVDERRHERISYARFFHWMSGHRPTILNGFRGIDLC
jgi:hypothetical protein